ncbi:MAG: PfkB family carbohydrate kinase [Kiritimatiellales bacterium]|jgi:sugar/nucleoside kinase (ribokinase family)
MTNSRNSFSLDAVVAGYLGVDIAPGFPPDRASVPASELFRPGKLIETEGLSISLGGVVANTGLAMKKFGQRVELMGCVGCDALGDVVVTQLQEQGVTGGIRRNRRAGTAYGIVVAPPGMDRIFFEDPGCNGVFSSDDIDCKTVAESRLFHFGYPPLMKSLWENDGAELQKLFKRVRELGTATSLDMALPDSDSPAGKADRQSILANTLPYVDIFVPSIEEILFMLEPEHYARILAGTAGGDMVDAIPQELFERLADRILDMGVNVLMIKAGHRGAYIRTGDIGKLNSSTPLRVPSGGQAPRGLWAAPLPVDALRFKNACGAGDCAVAGFLSALLNGAEIETAARYAMLAGRDNLYGVDAYSGLSDWKKMTDVIEADSRR